MSIAYAADTTLAKESAPMEETSPETSSADDSKPETEQSKTKETSESTVGNAGSIEQDSEPESVKTEETVSEEQHTETKETVSEEQNTETQETVSEEQNTETEETVSEEQNTETEETVSEEQSTETESGNNESTETPSDTQPETETGTDAVKTFINKNGEAVIPSSLVGMDYSTIMDSYDGETNVIKQYQFSDSFAANAIMESKMDENGNLILVISQGSPAVEKTIAENVHNDSAPAIDGNFTGWEQIPVSYEYNWDNSQNCWNGCYTTDPDTGEQICYKTEVGTYDSNVRHEMQLYCDDKDVYLKIKYAAIYGSHANGDDFNFYIDGAEAKFSLTWPDGTPITGTDAASGTYVIDVRNGNSASSYSIVDGACAYYHVTENGVNNELELRIPLEALQAQNGNINLDNFSMIQFFTQNLMYRKISAAGSPTGSVPFAATAFLGIPASYVWLKKRALTW